MNYGKVDDICQDIDSHEGPEGAPIDLLNSCIYLVIHISYFPLIHWLSVSDYEQHGILKCCSGHKKHAQEYPDVQSSDELCLKVDLMR